MEDLSFEVYFTKFASEEMNNYFEINSSPIGILLVLNFVEVNLNFNDLFAIRLVINFLISLCNLLPKNSIYLFFVPSIAFIL